MSPRLCSELYRSMWLRGWGEFDDASATCPTHLVPPICREAYSRGWAERSRFDLNDRREYAESVVGDRCPRVRIVWGGGIREYPNRRYDEARRG